jgi:hypothetical protein
MRYKALQENDRATMELLLHPLYTCLTPWNSVLTKQQFLDQFFDQLEPYVLSDSPIVLDLEILSPIARTSVVELSGHGQVGGRRVDGTYQTSHTLIKLNGAWIFLAAHFDKVALVERQK